MNTQNPAPDPASGYMPNGVVGVATVGGSVASIAIYALGLYGINMPAGIESAVASLVTVLAAYIHPAARQSK